LLSVKKINSEKIESISSSIECMCIGVFKGGNIKKDLSFISESDKNLLMSAVKLESFKGSLGESLMIYGTSSIKRIYLYGLGDVKSTGSDLLRSLSAKVSKDAINKKMKSIHLYIDSFTANGKFNNAVIEGALLGSYYFDEYKSSTSKKNSLDTIIFVSNQKELPVKEGIALCESVSLSRDLGNHPANIQTPTYLAKKAEDISAADNMKCEIIDVSRFKKMKLNSFYGVAQGAKEPAKMILVNYKGGPVSSKPIALVGKGLTFDSGGISIKPAPKMDEMKFDMCGAATVLGLMNAVALLQPKVNIVFAIGATENMPGSNAQRPGDIVKAYNGKTIEVLNTDAEGRLVLADVLSYVNKKFNPECILDFATLTGAVIVALGNRATGVMGNNTNLINDIKKSSEKSDEKVWELPLWPEYSKDIKGTYADIQNIGKNGAGTITAGAFLKEFVENTPWCHFDIAGTAWGPKTPHYQPDFGATGVAVRLVYDFIKNRSK